MQGANISLLQTRKGVATLWTPHAGARPASPSTMVKVTTEFLLSGSVGDYDAAAQTAIKTVLAAEADDGARDTSDRMHVRRGVGCHSQCRRAPRAPCEGRAAGRGRAARSTGACVRVCACLRMRVRVRGVCVCVCVCVCVE